jgi:hypothetical protein
MELFSDESTPPKHLRARGRQWTIVRSTAFLEAGIALMQRDDGRARAG